MAGGPVEQAGALVACPRCGTEVMMKATIPVLAADGVGLDFVCVPCARSLVVQSAPGDEGVAADAEG